MSRIREVPALFEYVSFVMCRCPVVWLNLALLEHVREKADTCFPWNMQAQGSSAFLVIAHDDARGGLRCGGREIASFPPWSA